MSGRDNYDFLATLGGGGGGAPTNASYVVIGLNGTLTDERVLTAGGGITITDGGAGGNVTIAATGGIADGDKGDITVSSSGTVWTIDAGTVTNAKLANVSTATLKGRTTAGSGSPEDLTGTQATALLDTFTSALKGLVPASGGGTTNFLRADGTFAAPPGGGGANVGTATVDFGAFPGSSDASVTVTGQAGIVAGSIVQAWIRPVATADHSADEHMLETLKVYAHTIVAGTGFTISAFNAGTLNEPGEDPRAKDNLSQIAARPGGRGQQDGLTAAIGGKGTRIYGQWTIAWSWS